MVEESANATPSNVLWSSFRTITFHGLPRSEPVSGVRVSVSVIEPVVELRVPCGRRPVLELDAQLCDGAEALCEHVVGVDRLEIDLPRVEEVLVVELRKAVERRGERDSDLVLDEPRLE